MGLFQDLVNKEKVLQGTPELQAIAGKNPDTMNAWQDTSAQSDYVLGSFLDRMAIERKFAAEHEQGRGIINHYEGPSRGSLENLKNLAIESFKSAGEAVRLSNDVANDKVHSNTAKILADSALRAAQQYTPEPSQRVNAMAEGVRDRFNNAQGFGETALAIGKGITDTLGEVVTNPEGVVQTFAQSAGNALPVIAGTIAGSKAGAALGTVVAPGAGTLAGAGTGAVGGFIGSFFSSLSIEAGAKLSEEANAELVRLNLEPTEANFAAILADKTFTDPAFKDARGKALGTAGVDSLLQVAGGKIATGPARTAQKLAHMKAAADAPQEVIDALTHIELRKMSLGSKAKAHVNSYGVELISEPISELAGQLNTDDKVDAGELSKEFLGGIGSSIVGKHVDTAVFGTKLAAGATAATVGVVPGIAKAAVEGAVNTVQDLTTKKTAFRDQMDELHKATSVVGYGDKVTSLAQSGDISKHIDPDTDDYNPHLAIDALAAINRSPDTAYETKAENLDQALSITNKFALERKTRMDFQEELEAKNKAKNPDDLITKQEQVMLRDLRRVADGDSLYLTKLEKITESLSKAGQSIDESKSLLDEAAKASTPEEGIAVLKRIFGSNGGGSIDSLGSSIEAIKSHPNATPETVSFIKDAQEFSHAYTALNRTYADTSQEVNDNILKGSDGYRSIESYTKNVAGALNNGNESFATKELGKLNAFATHQRTKVNTLTAYTEAIRNKVPISPELQSSFDTINKIRVTNSGGKLKPFSIHKGSVASKYWATTLSNMEMEANALEKGLKVATGLFGLHQKKAPAIEIQEATSPVVDIPEVKGTSVSPAKESVTTEATATSEPKGKRLASVKTLTAILDNTEAHKVMSHTAVTSRINKATESLNISTHPEDKAIFQAELEFFQKLLTTKTPPKPSGDTANKPTTVVSDEIETKKDSNTLAAESSVKPDSTQLKPEPDKPKEAEAVVNSKPEWLQTIANDWLKLLGITSNVQVLTLESAKDNLAQLSNFPGIANEITRMGQQPKSFGWMQKDGKGNYLILLKTTSSKASMLDVLSHEIGHILEQTTWNTTDAKVRKSIVDEFIQWKAIPENGLKDFYDSKKSYVAAKKVAGLIDDRYGDNPPLFSSLSKEDQKYLLQFDEWFADQVARWANSSEQPLTVVDKFFKRLADALRKLYTTASGDKYLPNSKMKEYLDALAKRNSKPNESITEEVKPNGKSKEGERQGNGRLLVKDALDESPTAKDTNGEEVSNESLVVGAQEFTAEEFASLDQSLKDEWTALNEEIALYNAILDCVS